MRSIGFAKRGFDIIFALCCLMLLFPIGLIIYCLIRLESKGPAIFKQKRVGKNMQPYLMYKFRSMYVHAFTPEELGPIKNRHKLVTPLGAVLRRTKLDEIPQFLNVLKGNMSVVGPRPCLFSTLETISYSEKRRYEVLPGLTGWAEINGNVELNWQEQLTLDLWYVDHRSFKLDLYIIWRTVITMLVGSVKNDRKLAEAKHYLQSKINGS